MQGCIMFQDSPILDNICYTSADPLSDTYLQETGLTAGSSVKLTIGITDSRIVSRDTAGGTC